MNNFLILLLIYAFKCSTLSEVKPLALSMISCDFLKINEDFIQIYIYDLRGNKRDLIYFYKTKSDIKKNIVDENLTNRTHIAFKKPGQELRILYIDVTTKDARVIDIPKLFLIFKNSTGCFYITTSDIYIVGNYTGFKGENLQLSCDSVTHSRKNLKYQWIKNNMILENEQNQKLTINSVISKDEGLYSCKNNNEESSQFSFRVIENPIFEIKKPQFCFLNYSFNLICEIRHHFVPNELEIRWTVNENKVLNYNISTYLNYSVLNFAKFLSKDNGDYKCLIMYKPRNKEFSSNIVSIKGQELPKLWISQPKNIIESTEVYLNCNINHNLPVNRLKVSWFNNSKLIEENIITNNDSTLSILHFKNISRFDTGKYLCAFQVLENTFEVDGTINVFYRPSCKVENEEYYLKYNTTKFLECDVTSSYPSKVHFTWFRSKNNEVQKVGFEKKISVLILEEEMYYCSTTNEVFQDYKPNCTHKIKIENNVFTIKSDQFLNNAIISLAVIVIVLLIAILITKCYHPRILSRRSDMELKRVQRSLSLPENRLKCISEINIPVNKSIYEDILLSESQLITLSENSISNIDNISALNDNIPLLKVIPLKLMGTGYFGEVFQGKLLQTISNHNNIDEYVAVKIFKDCGSNLQQIKKFNEEMTLHFKVSSHPYIIQCLGKTYIEGKFGIVMEFSTKGTLKILLRKLFLESLSQLVRAKTEYYDNLNYKCMKFAREIAAGMDHITKFKVIHRDLAARNILLGNNEECKISDFGLSRNISSNNEYEMGSNDPVPVRWLAPECLINNIFTEKTDVWAYGIVLWEIVSLGGVPYCNLKNGYEVKGAVTNGYRMPRLKHCNEELYAIMMLCWEKYPENRPTFVNLSQMLDHILEHSREYLNFNLYEQINYEFMDNNKYRESLVNPDMNTLS